VEVDRSKVQKELRDIAKREGPTAQALQTSAPHLLAIAEAATGCESIDECRDWLIGVLERAIAMLDVPRDREVARAAWRRGDYTDDDLEDRLNHCAITLRNQEIARRIALGEATEDDRARLEGSIQPRRYVTMRRYLDKATPRLAQKFADLLVGQLHRGGRRRPKPISKVERLLVERLHVTVNIGADRRVSTLDYRFDVRAVANDVDHFFWRTDGGHLGILDAVEVADVTRCSHMLTEELSPRGMVRNHFEIPRLELSQRHTFGFQLRLHHQPRSLLSQAFFTLTPSSEETFFELVLQFESARPQVVWTINGLSQSLRPGEPTRHNVIVPAATGRLEEVRQYAAAHEAETGRFPKTLIFAVNDLPHTSHADQLVDIARDVFGHGEAFVGKITGRVDRPLQRIREFRNRPNPKVVVTVDLLTTGVDIPDLEYLVFLRPVKSRILFEQMLGRGTRRSPDLVPAKTHFTVFDCFDGTLLEYFRATTGMTVEPPEGDGKSIEQIIDDIWQNRDRDYNTRRLIKRLRRIDKNMSGDARDLFARFIADGDVAGFAEELPAKLRGDFAGTMQTLRHKEFLKLLTDYPRAQRTFIVAPGVTDTVESQWLIKAATGQEYKPADYLQLFVHFVEEHEREIEAIQILLARPADWSADALRQLREGLVQAPEHFTVESLQRAFQATHHKALVDIISMVKRAAIAEAPLLTAEERVDRAIARITADREFTDEQARWINYIRQHLVQNLSIEREDFDEVPVLLDRGGWGRANRIFSGELDGLLHELNREVAA
jgi:hypothetical protein